MTEQNMTNPEREILNSKQYQITKIPMTKTILSVLNLDIWICLGFNTLGGPD